MATTNTTRTVETDQGTAQLSVQTPGQSTRTVTEGQRTITSSEVTPEQVITRSQTTPETVVTSATSRPETTTTQTNVNGGHYAMLVRMSIPFHNVEPPPAS